jgi:hypothetical protein
MTDQTARHESQDLPAPSPDRLLLHDHVRLRLVALLVDEGVVVPEVVDRHALDQYRLAGEQHVARRPGSHRQRGEADRQRRVAKAVPSRFPHRFQRYEAGGDRAGQRGKPDQQAAQRGAGRARLGPSRCQQAGSEERRVQVLGETERPSAPTASAVAASITHCSTWSGRR